VKSYREKRQAIDLSWANCRPDSSYDAVLSQSDCTAEDWKHLKCPQPSTTEVELAKFTDVSGQNVFRERLVQKLLSYCKENLSEHLVPCSLVLAGALP
jgi:hypothetical protein